MNQLSEIIEDIADLRAEIGLKPKDADGSRVATRITHLERQTAEIYERLERLELRLGMPYGITDGPEDMPPPTNCRIVPFTAVKGV